jgi:CPA2 family monovalent cation:H+ antiporter-2
MDPMLPAVVATITLLLVAGIILRLLKQPFAVACIIAGIALGPHGFSILEHADTVNQMGSFGVIFLLFFAGLHFKLEELGEHWRLAVFGTLFQIAVSVGCVSLLGHWLSWSMGRILFFGFAISLSSTAVAIRLCDHFGESKSPIGHSVLGVLLVQDLLVVPMMIALTWFSGDSQNSSLLIRQCVGALILMVGLFWLFKMKPNWQPPWEALKNDSEIQLFSALACCLGAAWVTGLLGLSSALGAFVAGVFLGTITKLNWLAERLESFRAVALAVFFVSVGMGLDLNFIHERWIAVVGLSLAALLTNTFINGGICRAFGMTWLDGLFAGALLAQIGEFSFVLAAIARQAQLIEHSTYLLTMAVIAVTMLVSPIWSAPFRWLRYRQNQEVAE